MAVQQNDVTGMAQVHEEPRARRSVDRSTKRRTTRTSSARSVASCTWAPVWTSARSSSRAEPAARTRPAAGPQSDHGHQGADAGRRPSPPLLFPGRRHRRRWRADGARGGCCRWSRPTASSKKARNSSPRSPVRLCSKLPSLSDATISWLNQYRKGRFEVYVDTSGPGQGGQQDQPASAGRW